MDDLLYHHSVDPMNTPPPSYPGPLSLASAQAYVEILTAKDPRGVLFLMCAFS